MRGIFGGGNKNEDSDTQTSSSSHVSANASRTEKKEVTKAYAVSDVRARLLAKTAWWTSDVTNRHARGSPHKAIAAVKPRCCGLVLTLHIRAAGVVPAVQRGTAPDGRGRRAGETSLDNAVAVLYIELV